MQDFGEVSGVQMHHFSDASELAYGIVSYLRRTNSDGNVSCSFRMSQSRLAPLKTFGVDCSDPGCEVRQDVSTAPFIGQIVRLCSVTFRMTRSFSTRSYQTGLPLSMMIPHWSNGGKWTQSATLQMLPLEDALQTPYRRAIHESEDHIFSSKVKSRGLHFRHLWKTFLMAISR